MAEKDLQQIQIIAGATSQDGYAATIERLRNTLGQIVVYVPSYTTLNMDDDSLDPEFDRAGLEALRQSVRAPRTR